MDAIPFLKRLLIDSGREIRWRCLVLDGQGKGADTTRLGSEVEITRAKYTGRYGGTPLQLRRERMDQEEYDDFYQQFYLEPSIPGTLERYLKGTPWTTILDVGCGDGAMLYALNQLGYLKGKTVFAIDLSPKRVKRTQSISKEFSCHVDDACELRKITSNSIDFLVSSQVIEHVPDDDAMIRQIARVLSEGGIAYVSTVFKTPNAWYFYKQNGQSVIDPTHQREYMNDNELTGLLDSHYLSVIETIKTPIAKPIVGFHILSRIGAARDAFIRSALLRSLHRIRVPLPGYYIWEIVAKKQAAEK